MSATVGELPLARPPQVSPPATLDEIEQALFASVGHEVYVVDAESRLLGVVPDYELLKCRLIPGTHSVRARDLMKPQPRTVTAATPLDEVACWLRVHVHRSLPVVQAGRLVGCLDRRALLLHYAEAAGRQSLPREPAERPDASPPHIPPARPRFLQTPAIRSTPTLTPGTDSR